MFTGLVQHVGIVEEILAEGEGARVRIDPAGWPHVPAAGDSVAVNGCCLTVTIDPRAVEGRLLFHCVTQTLQVTALGNLRPGDGVNLEHALRPTDFLGGHLVQGHVDGVGVVSHVATGELEHRVRVDVPDSIARFLVDKGSITVEGVSLTLAAVGPAWFECALIPTTLAKTTLRHLSVGQRVNLEVDVIAKTVASWLMRCGFMPPALQH